MKRAACAWNAFEKLFVFNPGEVLPRARGEQQPYVTGVLRIPYGYLPVCRGYLYAGTVACAASGLTPLKVTCLQVALRHGTPLIYINCDDRPGGGRLWHVMVVNVDVLLSWLAAIPRRLGEKLFATNDIEACWRGWQIIKRHGGLGRRYRDPRFDTLAACGRCRGAGVSADQPCGPCQGSRRLTRGEVS